MPSYLEQLPDDIIYLIYEKKHRLEYADVMIQFKKERGGKYNQCYRYNSFGDNSLLRVGDAVKTEALGYKLRNTLFVVIWKGKKYIDLYSYNTGEKHRLNHHTHTIRPSTVQYIMYEINNRFD